MNIFILAGEPSGDEYGAELMKQMQCKNPEIKFHGIGGPLMAQYGLKSMVDFNKMSVMGFVEILKSIGFFISLEKKVVRFIEKNNFDKVVLIDYPGLNLRLCQKIKQKTNCELFYYISPQIWAWKEKRVEIIRTYVDHMIVIFKFEKIWYAKKNIAVEYVGHPFLDIWQKNNTESLIRKYNINTNQPIVTLFPGSRNQEIKKHLDLCIGAALKIKQTIPDLQILLGLHPNINKLKIDKSKITVIKDEPLKALEIATFAIIASGTATLQAAIMNTPAIVIYKMHWLSWYLTKQLVKVQFASMANIIANELVFPELLQQKATYTNIAELGIQLINDRDYKNNMIEKMKLINSQIGEAGASERTAQFILSQKS